MICDRCKRESISRMMSMFNTDMCCMECIAKEKLHPKYDEARAIEHWEVLHGNSAFVGMGKPDDL